MKHEWQETLEDLEPRMQNAINELKQIISRRYPGTNYVLSRGHDDPKNVHLEAIVDLDDPDEVLDLIGERLDQLLVEERIPLYVIPLRTPDRILAELQAEAAAGRQRRGRSVPLLGSLPFGGQ